MYIFSLASNHQHHNTSRFPSALQQNRAQSRSLYSFYIREFVKFPSHYSLYSKQIIIFEAKKSVVRMFCTLIKHAKISQSKSLSKGIHSMQISAATSRGNPPQFKTKPSVLGKFERAKCKCFFKERNCSRRMWMNDSRIQRKMKIVWDERTAKLGCCDWCSLPLNASERTSEQALSYLLEWRTT